MKMSKELVENRDLALWTVPGTWSEGTNTGLQIVCRPGEEISAGGYSGSAGVMSHAKDRSPQTQRRRATRTLAFARDYAFGEPLLTLLWAPTNGDHYP